MTTGGLFQPQTFCDSVTILINEEVNSEKRDLYRGKHAQSSSTSRSPSSSNHSSVASMSGEKAVVLVSKVSKFHLEDYKYATQIIFIHTYPSIMCG